MSELTKLKILFFLKFCAEAMFLPFLALYYKELGFSEGVIGLFLAIPAIVGISLSPVYSIICKNVKVTKIIYSIITILNAICMFLFFKLTSYYPLLIVIILLNMFQANNFGVLEAFASVCSNHNKTDYSKVRVYGSVAYVLGLSLSGCLIKIHSFFLASIVAMIFTIISSVFAFMIKADYEEKHKKRDIKALIKNKQFFIFTIFFVLFVGTMNVGDDFYGTYLDETKGITNDIFGYIWASFIVVECAVIIFLSRFKVKFKFKYLYFVSVLCCVLRFMINALNAPLPIIIIAGLTKGITWGIHAYLWGQFIVHLTGKRNGGLAIIISTFLINIYQAILKILLGRVIDHTSYYVFYLILTYVLIGVLIFFAIVYRNDEYKSSPNKKNKKKVEKIEEKIDDKNEAINEEKQENNIILEEQKVAT